MSDKTKTMHLVHANVGLARGPLDSEVMREFVQQVDEINRIAHSSSGFIAQPVPPDSGEIFKGDFLLNVSIWDSVESLAAFSHSGKHVKALDDRAKWFEKQNVPNYVLFWIQVGEIPTELEIKKRIDYLAVHGATPYAFNFERSFTSPEAESYKI